MNAILKCEHVSKIYGIAENRITAVNDISLSVNQGEFTSIIGRSGSGKSTLLHLMAGLIPPTKGKVLLNGQNLTKMSEKKLTLLRRRNIGFVFQFFNLIPTQNVIENIVLPIHLDGKKEDTEYVEEILETLGLKDRKDAYIHELSGGLQQRVAIARALACKPEIIFADEPTGNLDDQSQKEVMHLLRETQKKYHQTVLMVTHNLNLARKTDRIIEIESGRIVGDFSRDAGNTNRQ